jgi:hypothetical protein
MRSTELPSVHPNAQNPTTVIAAAPATKPHIAGLISGWDLIYLTMNGALLGIGKHMSHVREPAGSESTQAASDKFGIFCSMRSCWPTAISTELPCAQLTSSSAQASQWRRLQLQFPMQRTNVVHQFGYHRLIVILQGIIPLTTVCPK